MIRSLTQRLALIATLPLLLLLVFAACNIGPTTIDDLTTKSLTIVTGPLYLTLTGPMTIPEHKAYGKLGGAKIKDGVVLDLQLKKGDQVRLEDRVDGFGKVREVTGVRRDPKRNEGRAGGSGPSSGKQLKLEGTIERGSTYTWTIPSLFGDAEAVVQVTGRLVATAYDNALVETRREGEVSLNTDALQSVEYKVSGPAPVWQAPLDTPFGRIEGTGTITTDGDMVLEFAGEPGDFIARGRPGFRHEDGTERHFGFEASFPVKLSVGETAATGNIELQGGFNVVSAPR